MHRTVRQPRRRSALRNRSCIGARIGACILVAGLTAPLAAAPQRAPSGGGAAPTTASPVPPPLDDATIAFVLPESERVRIRGAVERTVARTLKSTPPVRIVAPPEMGEVLLRSMAVTSPNRSFDPGQVEQLARRQTVLFDLAAKEIVIGSGGLAMVGEADRAAVARIMFAHAIMTAIVDQELSLAEFSRTDLPAVMVARRMASEGFTVTARDRATLPLGLDSFAATVRQHIPGSFDTRDDRSPLERTVYGNGRTVIEAIWNAQGVDAVWTRLAERPSSVPDLARAIPRSRALRLAQAALDPLLTQPDWTRVRMPSAPLVSLAGLKGPTLAERVAIASGCLVVDTLGYAGSRGGSILISSLRGADAQSTDRIAAAIRRVPEFLESDFERAQVRVRVTETTSEVHGVTVRTTVLAAEDEEDPMPATRVIDLVRGQEVISLSVTGVRLSPQVLQETLDKAIDTIARAIGEQAEFATADEASAVK